MEASNIHTPFSSVYDSFTSKITEDMYMELTREQTENMLCELLISAIPKFEFPRKNLFDYSREQAQFNIELSPEEVNILSSYMVVEWLGQQLASVEATRLRASGTDFKFTSQANHMNKLLQLKKHYETEGFHLQRLYKRRTVDDKGRIVSTIGSLMGRTEWK